ncbi:MAG TPA: nuclear transport factor 2 family protein [Sediminibacterium sp.]|nr:nuclear transport factor 2 family protein [Sediminibacterium sp.]
MTKVLLSILLLAIFQSAFSQDHEIEELKKLNQDWLNSYAKKDTATLSKVFADDFVLVSPKGAKMTKRDIISNLDKQETVSVTIDSIDVRLLTDEVGLITCYTTFVLKMDGKDVIGQNCYQDVYVKRKGKWFAVAAHVTLLAMK